MPKNTLKIERISRRNHTFLYEILLLRFVRHAALAVLQLLTNTSQYNPVIPANWAAAATRNNNWYVSKSQVLSLLISSAQQSTALCEDL